MLKSDARSRRGLAELEELEDRIEKLKQSFELFFSGVDNIDPTDKKVPIRRLITRLNEMHVKNPAIRFKFQSLVGRFVSLNQYWERTMRAIEDGRIERSYFRQPVKKGSEAKAYFSRQAPELGPEETGTGLEALPVSGPQEKDRVRRSDIRTQEIDEDTLNNPDRMRHKRPLEGPDRGPKAEPPPSPPARGLDETRIERVYQELVSARSEQGAPAAVNRDAVARQLRSQYDALREKYQGADIDFKVSTKDGRVVVKPIVKKA